MMMQMQQMAQQQMEAQQVGAEGQQAAVN
jgi:hypothetical protein